MLHAVSVPGGVATLDEASLLQVETQLESILGEGQLHLVIPAGTTGPGNVHWAHPANPSVATMEALQAKAEATNEVDAGECDEPAERSDTETSSIDDGCLVEGHFAERWSVLGESGLCKEKPSNKRKQKRGSQRIAEQLNECGVRMANTTDEVELKRICAKITTLCWLLVGRDKKGRTKRSSE